MSRDWMVPPETRSHDWRSDLPATPPSRWALPATLIVVVLFALATGYFAGRVQAVVCDDDVVFHPVSELHPDAYAGSYALCGLTPVVVLD